VELKSSLAPAEFKVDAAQRIIEGYAATFGNRDQGGDIILPGAFTKTLQERMPRKLLKLFRDHRELIGVPIDAREDAKGLFTVNKVSETDEGDEVLALVADGALSHMSIGYDPIRWEFESDETTGEQTRKLLELRLWEWGPVCFPMNEAAEITAVKALRDASQNVERVLCDLPGFAAARGYKSREVPDAVKAAAIDALLEMRRLAERLASEWSDTKGALPYKDCPMADQGMAWDGAAQVKAATVDDLRMMCAWVAGKGENKGDFKLPHHMAASPYKVVWRGVAAAAARLPQAQIPAGDVPRVQSHLGKHYKQFDQVAPWDKGKSAWSDFATKAVRAPETELPDLLEAHGFALEAKALRESAAPASDPQDTIAQALAELRDSSERMLKTLTPDGSTSPEASTTGNGHNHAAENGEAKAAENVPESEAILIAALHSGLQELRFRALSQA